MMIDRLLTFVIGICLCLPMNAQIQWEKSFSLPETTSTIDIIETSDGDFVLCGNGNFNAGLSAFLLKFNEQGDSIWFKNLDMSFASCIIETNNSDLLIAGDKIQRLDSDANEIWTLSQASTEIDESSVGELFSVHYDEVFKISASGQIISSDSIGISLNSFRDTMNYGVEFELSTESVSYTSIKVVNDSLIAIGGIQLGEQFPFNGYGPVTQLLLMDDFGSVNIIAEFFDSIISEAEFALLGMDFIQVDNGMTSELFAVCPSIPLSHIIQKTIVNPDGIFSAYTEEEIFFCTPFDYFVQGDSALLMRFAKMKFDSLGFYGIAPWAPFDFSYESNSMFTFDENGCYFADGIKFGDPNFGDDINNSLYIGSGRTIIAGIYDNYDGSIPTATPSRKFSVALISSDLEPCSAELFIETPQDLFSEQTANTTKLFWNHYSYKTDACLLQGGTISSLDMNAAFNQPPGTILIQGDNVLGDSNGFDFSPAFVPDAQFTLFNTSLFPNGITAELVPGAFYKWRVRCGCLVDPDLPLPERLQGNNVVLSPWSNWSVFENLD